MHEYEIAVLKFLKDKKTSDIDAIANGTKLAKDSVMWALENLSVADAVKVNRKASGSIALTKEGESYTDALPEEALVRSISKAGGSSKVQGLNNIGLIWAKRNNWIDIRDGVAKLTPAGVAAAKAKDSQLRDLLNSASTGTKAIGDLNKQERDLLAILEKRGLVKTKESSGITGIEITRKGIELSSGKADQGVGALTREIIKSGSWKGKGFRSYDINASSETVYPARLHPMHEFNNMVRDAWLNMGFAEVNGPIVESAFWNFDALFSRQDHPARDMQDTFFVSNPKRISIDDLALMKKIKKEHTEAWQEDWREELASQPVLRTHTTSVSAHYIRKFANVEEGAYPVKLFSIGKVFRNEAIDYKHLAELTQMDGIIIGNNLSLANLIDTIKRFFAQFGVTDIRFKPSYFPFTEPSLEVHYYDKEHNDMIEIAGAGIIRKEITRAMGTDKTVLAWAFGIERFLMKSLKLNSLTDLYKNDIGWLRDRDEIRI
ncbi:MAG: phenylalanine--tRNA ligase subunit alpha [Candidatus Micrarchaeota archaeon]|nr:phenylalanine--tRNA ligase subunit alpha [Candidatus Micrarchaeota archaeon]